MRSLVWIPSEGVEGFVLKSMAHGAEIEWIDPISLRPTRDYFGIDDYVILVDVDELESD